MSYGLSRKFKSRKERFKKNRKKLKLIVNLWMCYLIILSFSYTMSETYSAFSDHETIPSTIAIAEDFCADDDWASRHQEQCVETKIMLEDNDDDITSTEDDGDKDTEQKVNTDAEKNGNTDTEDDGNKDAEQNGNIGAEKDLNTDTEDDGDTDTEQDGNTDAEKDVNKDMEDYVNTDAGKDENVNTGDMNIDDNAGVSTDNNENR